MVITSTSHVDGQAHQQPVVIEGQETQDPDEPPLSGLSASDIIHDKPDGVIELQDVSTSSNSISNSDSHDISKQPSSTWDRDPGTAHAFDGKNVAIILGVDLGSGLSSNEATARLQRDGPNKLEGAGQVSVAKVLLRQVSNSLTIVLLIAMALSYGTLDFIEGAVISAVILLNIVLGFVQDYKAEKTMQSLLSLAAPNAHVLRNGRVEIIKAENLVVGDIVKLNTGDIVPADLRLLESVNLEVDEASQTGESLAVSKDATKVLAGGMESSTGDRVNMAYSATTVTRGRGTGVVVAIGMNTLVGSVASLMRGKPEKTKRGPFAMFLNKFWLGFKGILGLVGTPMQIKLSQFAILLFGLAILLAIIVFSVNKWELYNEVVLYGICVAVAVIPESLIAVMTITMAVGVKAMAQGNVVVRRMAALEAIGGVTNICSDKTGTLTQGKMVAHKVWVPKMGILTVKDTTNHVDPEDGVVDINDGILDSGSAVSHPKLEILRPVLDSVALCNFASVFRRPATQDSMEKVASSGDWTATGDPTEIALQVLAMRFGRGKDAILSAGQLTSVVEHQFESSLKRMSIAYKDQGNGNIEVLAKGASESILPILNISGTDRAILENMLDRLASDGLRVICVAKKVVPEGEQVALSDRTIMESELEFQGLIGLRDPPRLETSEAVQKCHMAGITVHMLTGDHLVTASAIAQEVGILKSESQTSGSVMQAQDFDKLSDADIDAMPSLPLVLARCSPTTKVRMVDALKRRKAFCVMTGDGVNDAPALNRADVGIAMGINGTDVAKDAADMILTDDNFASIVKAVEEGRRLFDNIQKFLMHLLISNIAQVILLLIALAFKDGDGNSVFPLSPLEILWVNMITSSFLALGLGMEEAQTDIMTRRPRDMRVGVFTRELITDKMLYGSFAGILCLVSFVIVVYGDGHGNLGVNCNENWNETCDVVYRGRATVFAVLSFLLLVTAWEVKHFGRSLFNLDPRRFRGKSAIFKALVYNRFLLWAVVAGFLITFPVVYIPVVNETVFKHKGITWEWGVVLGCFVSYVAFVEAWKAIKRRLGLWSGSTTKQMEFSV
ncbi:related to potassium/sodium P-type ATPase [Phialocephala subalpina]|uniref:P-type Na(+) transporter n=1 Tax=Phialocephala subalpina TaxID=576137 RepID=A0A1L7XK85_9HELO|nr:related to potassium/sodium P-type ATPase [Phialocephala subalpina]